MISNCKGALTLAVGFALLATGPAAAAQPVVGRPAPDFTLKTFDGQKVSLSDLKGQVVVLNFWATWCGPCKRELPLLDAYFRVQQKFGLRVFAITTDDDLAPYALRPLAKALAIPMVRYIRGPYAYPDGVPTNYVIDRSGVLRYARAGAFDLDSLNATLVPLLKEAPPAVATAVSATQR